MSNPNQLDDLEFGEIPGLDEAQERVAAVADRVDDIYIEKPGDNDCTGGACSI